MACDMSAEEAVAAASQRLNNWDRWGSDDALVTLNFIGGPKRRSAVQSVRSAESISLSLEYGLAGAPEWKPGPLQPAHDDADEREHKPPAVWIRCRRRLVMMPMQRATHWDGLGHIFDHGTAWNGRRASEIVTVAGGLGDRHREGGTCVRHSGSSSRRRARSAMGSFRTALPSRPSGSR